MKHYEVTFIVNPVLSDDEMKATVITYQDLLKDMGCSITAVDEFGLRTLAYPINKCTTGRYYGIEFTAPSGEFMNKFELALKRDERILRFLTVRLDKFGVQYNKDKREGKIGKKKEAEAAVENSKS